MGIKLFSSGSSYEHSEKIKWFSDNCITKDTNTSPNPNPYRFKVKHIFKSKKHIMYIINYPDAVTYNGDKILIYNIKQENKIKKLIEDKNLDPHFLENETSPIVRFPANEEGFDLALKFLDIKGTI